MWLHLIRSDICKPCDHVLHRELINSPLLIDSQCLHFIFSARHVQSFMPGPETCTSSWSPVEHESQFHYIYFKKTKQGSVGWLHQHAVFAPAIYITISGGSHWYTPNCKKIWVWARLCVMQAQIFSSVNCWFAAWSLSWSIQGGCISVAWQSNNFIKLLRKQFMPF